MFKSNQYTEREKKQKQQRKYKQNKGREHARGNNLHNPLNILLASKTIICIHKKERSWENKNNNRKINKAKQRTFDYCGTKSDLNCGLYIYLGVPA